MKGSESQFDPIYKELATDYPDVSAEAIDAAVKFKTIAAKLFLQREEMFSRYGLTSGRFHLMMLLKSEESRSLSPSELAKRTGVTRATMTQFVDALEKEDYVKRADDPKDRRGMLVQLTEKGLSKLKEIMPEYLKRLTNFTKVLTEEEQAQHLFIMEKLYSGMIDNQDEYEEE